ncbi:MAG: n-acetylglutamate synthase [Saprospiraceae bacterium]|nr:n-acetylglutamate synthase [Saprospiraceae bacterium]
MKPINYDGKVFKSILNQGGGDVDSETIFFYHQKDNYLWGHYEGGSVAVGVLMGQVGPDGTLQFTYWHYNLSGELKSGTCHSTAKFNAGVLHLHEKWRWTSGAKGAGTSIIQEIKKE